MNKKLLQEFEDHLNPAKAENKKFDFRILGYGEISTVFDIKGEAFSGWAFKRLPLFKTLEQAENYIDFYKKYNQKLEETGLNLPKYEGIAVKGHKGIYVAYLMQERLNANAVAHKLLHKLPDDELLILLELVLKEVLKVWTFNSENKKLILGLDAQISNWAVKEFNENNPAIYKHSELYFIDTSTPLMQENGVEQLDAELLLKSAPAFIRPVLRMFFLDDVLTRYYSFRDICIDILANFIKEQRKDLIEPALPVVNEFYEKHHQIIGEKPLQAKEVFDYYKEDKLIWSIFLSARRFDRFIQTKIFGKHYEFILPGKIKR
ncbi:MAG: DUF6206 family protein [Bacteroidales bacterium]|nr:DUF6206 family protein [Bacteroidales bacterium]